jgi:hypothetical protein
MFSPGRPARCADPTAQARGALAPRVVNRRIQAWRQAGLVRTRTFLMGTPATVWLTADGLARRPVALHIGPAVRLSAQPPATCGRPTAG